MILMNDFKKEYALLKPEIERAVFHSFESGWYILGKQVEQFEKEFATYVGTNFCIGVANGMEALQIALMALGIGRGDEVITVSNSAVATALAISNTGATPIFVDVDEYYLIDTLKIEEKITSKTKAIIPVHLFGQMADMEKLREIAKKYNLKIVEDACQAHGATINDKKSGCLSDLGCFSFYPTKNLGAYGDGGAITTSSKELYEKCKLFRNYGQKNRYEHETKGLNSRLDEIQAAILTVKLTHLENFIEKRNLVAQRYMEGLKNVTHIILPKIKKDSRHAFHLFVIQTDKRDGLQTFLKAHDVESLIHYPIPIHKQKCYSDYNELTLPSTEYYSKNMLSLPINPQMEMNEIDMVCNLIKSFYKKYE